LSTWLYRLTVNVVLMRLRANHVKPVSLDTSGTTDDFGESAILNACPVDDMRLSGAIDRITLHRALRELPPGYRTIFLLHDVEGKAHSEIARELGCSIGNSKSQLHQARTRLRRFLRRPLGRFLRQSPSRSLSRNTFHEAPLTEHRTPSTGFPDWLCSNKSLESKLGP
jgi:RNA polymerase sigma-70 factor (ECF subfamily)